MNSHEGKFFSVSWRRIQLAWLLAAVVLPPGALSAGDPVSDAIDRGIEYLKGAIEQQQVGQTGDKGVGQTALETYALVVAGVSVDDPVIRGNFEYLESAMAQAARGGNPRRRAAGAYKKRPYTYGLSCYVFALDAAVSQIENDLLILNPRIKRLRDDPRIGAQYRPHLEDAVDTLVSLQRQNGAWRYGPPRGQDDFDNSNTQFAVLALGVGAKRGVTIEPAVWKGIMDHFLKGQQAQGPETDQRITMLSPEERRHGRDDIKVVSKDGGKQRGKERDSEKEKGGRGRTVVGPDNPEIGTEDIEVYQRGWSYRDTERVTWNMTCAGLSSLLLVRDNLKKLAPDGRKQLNAAVRDGYGWIMEHWAPNHNLYGTYSLEKVADIGSVKKFGRHDWYDDVSQFLVKAQRGDGSWSNRRGPRIATSFALLVLNRATSLLTMNPANRIVISGRSSAKDPNDRSWVYVSDLNATVHYPTLLRQIRLRPHPKLIRFLDDIVRSYPEEWKGELIPEMARVRDALANKAARGMIEDYLTDITGHFYRDWESYLKWHRRWERVVDIGSNQKKEQIPDLLKYYENTQKSLPLKKTIAWALVRCKARQAIPLLLNDLDHENGKVRLLAYDSFRAFFIDSPPPFSATGSKRTRDAQIEAVKAWYARQAGN